MRTGQLSSLELIRKVSGFLARSQTNLAVRNRKKSLRPKRFSTSHPPETCLGIFSGELIGIYFCKGNLNDQSGAEFGASLTL
ncbi:hypothetical protein BV898_03569 [Hypsibius exemplaris]|uniref:Uncharacterized protein n=1 Tax=Hypsibius exemplaris TaxID=2072580 RepID=A0A1W0X4H4_HYPEX|nr:hypothetical protein BV898_03569 [Hypsibius exemplaris]